MIIGLPMTKDLIQALKLKFKPHFKMCLMILTCLTLTSCAATLSSCGGCTTSISSPTNDVWRYNSFVKIEMEIQVRPTRCESVPQGIECNILMAILPPQTMRASGSGLVVMPTDHSTYILTADHVCRVDEEEVIPVRTPFGVARVVVQQSMSISTIDYYGNVREAQYHSSDRPNDICLIRTRGTWGQATPIAERLPAHGEIVYNVAAPYGIFNPGMVLTFTGRYSGHDERQRHFYTIPARPGSSGSSILNSEGEIVGVIHSAHVRFEHMTISASLSSIQALMQTIQE